MKLLFFITTYFYDFKILFWNNKIVCLTVVYERQQFFNSRAAKVFVRQQKLNHFVNTYFIMYAFAENLIICIVCVIHISNMHTVHVLHECVI